MYICYIHFLKSTNQSHDLMVKDHHPQWMGWYLDGEQWAVELMYDGHHPKLEESGRLLIYISPTETGTLFQA
jgi:hypothetical protein